MKTCNIHTYIVTMELFKVEREKQGDGGVGVKGRGGRETWAGVGWGGG